jgi:hypothetical protein
MPVSAGLPLMAMALTALQACWCCWELVGMQMGAAAPAELLAAAVVAAAAAVVAAALSCAFVEQL